MTPTSRTKAGALATSLSALGLLFTAGGAPASSSAALGSDMPTWSPDGLTLAYVGFRKGRAGDIYQIGAYGGREERLTATKHHDDMPRWSPDGNRIVFVRTVGLVRQLVVMNSDGTGQRQLTHGREASFAPSWSPDSRRVAFARGRDDADSEDGIAADGSGVELDETPDRTPSDIYVLDLAGGGETRLTHDPAIDTSPAWSPTGDVIVFTSTRGATAAQQLFVMRTDGSGQRKLTDHPISYQNEKRPAWSPDGSTIAFVAEGWHAPLGNSEIYLVDANGSNLRRFTYFDGNDDWPAWSSDGKIAVTRGITAFRPEVFVMGATGGLGARKVTGRFISFAGMSMTPSIPRAAKPLTVELAVRPGIDGFTDVECRARVGEQLFLDPTMTRAKGRLRCVWQLPAEAKGRWLRGHVLAATGGSEVIRKFAMRVR